MNEPSAKDKEGALGGRPETMKWRCMRPDSLISLFSSWYVWFCVTSRSVLLFSSNIALALVMGNGLDVKSRSIDKLSMSLLIP